jgi:hypothetical protein
MKEVMTMNRKEIIIKMMPVINALTGHGVSLTEIERINPEIKRRAVSKENRIVPDLKGYTKEQLIDMLINQEIAEPIKFEKKQSLYEQHKNDKPLKGEKKQSLYEQHKDILPAMFVLKNKFEYTYSKLSDLINGAISSRQINKYLLQYNEVAKLANSLQSKTEKQLLSKISPKKKTDTIEKDDTQTETQPYTFVVTKNVITMAKDSETRSVEKDNEVFQDVKNAILDKDYQNAWSMMDVKQKIVDVLSKIESGDVSIDGDTITYKGITLKNGMVDRIMHLLKIDNGKYAKHLANFADKCMKNPSFRAVNELLNFMEKNTLPITPDGDFLAYKKVKHDFKDIYSGKYDNSVGKVVEMPRNEVDDNYEQTCSAGLHVCGYSYLKHFGSSDGKEKIVVCKVNPADVVSVPRDYNDQKMRTCRYEVIKTINQGEQLTDMFIS